jgi:hypothetical protein
MELSFSGVFSPLQGSPLHFAIIRACPLAVLWPRPGLVVTRELFLDRDFQISFRRSLIASIHSSKHAPTELTNNHRPIDNFNRK